MWHWLYPVYSACCVVLLLSDVQRVDEGSGCKPPSLILKTGGFVEARTPEDNVTAKHATGVSYHTCVF